MTTISLQPGRGRASQGKGTRRKDNHNDTNPEATQEELVRRWVEDLRVYLARDGAESVSVKATQAKLRAAGVVDQ